MIHEGIEVVSVRHYSSIKPFKSLVLSIDNDNVSIKLTKDFAALNFFEEDPITVGYEINNEVFVCEGKIKSVNLKNNSASVEIGEFQSITDKRMEERFPVSFYAEARDNITGKREICIINDISFTGISLSSKVEVGDLQEIELDTYIGEHIFPLKGKIAWKKHEGDKFFYGLQIVYMDYASRNVFRNYLKKFKEEEERMIGKLKEKK